MEGSRSAHSDSGEDPREGLREDLREDQILLDRFALVRCLRTDGASHLWLARDRHLQAELLVQIYAGAAVGGDVLESVKRDARSNRRLHHPHLARIQDVHEGRDMVVVSLSPSEGELLGAALSRTGPLPFRDVIGRVRPLVDGLLHLHDSGGQHGRVDADHVLAEDETRWVLLPADGTKPPRSDVEQLGALIAAALTGGRGPEAGRELNDAAELLHDGRTVPALLNQLVVDLHASHGEQRRAGMHDVLHRLEQIERYVEVGATAPSLPEATATPADVVEVDRPTPEIAVTAPAPPAPRSHSKWPVVVVLLAAAALVYPAMLFWDGRVAPPTPTETDTPTETPAPTPTGGGTPETEVADTAGTDADAEARAAAEKLAAAKQQADAALNDYLGANRDAEAIGAAAWGGEAYQDAVEIAAAGDRAFLDQRYDEATEQYGEATTALRDTIEARDAALVSLIQEGAIALETPDAERAATAFRTALLIEPTHEFARIGLQRAGTLDEVNRLLASGLAHENEGRLDFAHADYAAAAELDPHSEAAAAAYRGIKAGLADEQFRAMMSRALEAYHLGDFEAARLGLAEAQRFRPDAPEIAPALEMIAEAEVRREIDRLREEGVRHETREQWQAAWNTYRQTLAIDATIQYAQEGKVRCETMIRLEKHVEHYLSKPDRLIQSGPREDAARLVKTLDETPGLGPRLRDAHARLAEQVRLASTPLRVSLESDDKTEVAVYKVGRYGTFKTTVLELLPGVYTVVGQRKGYKDVRLTLRLKPGQTQTTLRVVCTERI